MLRSVRPEAWKVVRAEPVEATALTILGAMREATLYIARAQDHDQARQDAGAVMNRIISALAAG